MNGKLYIIKNNKIDSLVNAVVFIDDKNLDEVKKNFDVIEVGTKETKQDDPVSDLTNDEQ